MPHHLPAVWPLAWFLCCGLPALTAQTTLLEGLPGAVGTVRLVDTTGQTPTNAVLLDQVLLRSPVLNGRTANEDAETDRCRLVRRHGFDRIERPDGGRLFVFEQTLQTGHGLLFVPPSGPARVVYSGPEQLDVPMAIAVDGQHVVFARDQSLVVVRLDGGVFASTGTPSRTVAMGDTVIGRSLTVGTSHVFCVSDDDRVHRCALADGGQPTDITPPATPGRAQSELLAISGNGQVIAFLREGPVQDWMVWVADTVGVARAVALPPAPYREPGYLPEGSGQPHLLLDHAGSRLLVTESAVEDELYVVDTGVGGTASHLTGSANFAAYIGVHILPKFVGGRLMFASGHVGWSDWYARQPDGSVLNLTQTGSSEPPFLVGSLAVASRYPLADGRGLATEGVGALLRVRLLDPAGGSVVMFDDVLAPPLPGSSATGVADLLVAGVSGSRIVGGVDGSVRLAVPAGIELTPPVRSSSGWVATYAHLAGGLGVPVVLLPDGSLLLGSLALSIPQVAWDGPRLLVLWPDRLQVLGAAGVSDMPLPVVGQRAIVSGAGG